MANRHRAANGRFARGGKVEGTGTREAKMRSEAGLATGGAVKATKLKTGGKVPALATGGRLDKRARGGGVGADKSPFSSAKLK